MKAMRTALFLLLTACLLTVPVYASLPEPGTGTGFYVQDEANVLSSDTEEQILEYNAYLERVCDGAQMAVVTVNYLDTDTDVAATRLMNDRGLGSAEQSNGMLLLLVAKEARGWLAVGAGLDRAFSDEQAGEYLEDYFWPDVDAGRFDEAVQTLTARLYDWYLDYYKVNDTAYGQSGGSIRDIYGYEPAPAGPSTGSSVFRLVLVVLVLIVLIWFLGAASRFTRMRRWGYSGGFFPIFWFGGRRRYNDWYRRQPPPPPGPRGPGPGPGPGGFMGGGAGGPRPGGRTSTFTRPSSPRGSGFGGRSRGGGAGRSGGSFRSGGFGGHSGGGGAGRR